MKYRIINEMESARLAMLIDTEGWIGLSRNNKGRKYTPGIFIVNTNKTIIEWARSVIEGMPHSYYSIQYEGNRKLSHRIMIRKADVLYHILQHINPWLICKKENGELILEFCKARMADTRYGKSRILTARDYEIYERLTVLNHKGL